MYNIGMIYLGADTHGFETIAFVKEYLTLHKKKYVDLGIKEKSDKQKIENIIFNVAQEVLKNENNIGILSCGTGVGVEVGVNKFGGIRGCLATSKKIAKYAIEKDKCNVLCLVGWNNPKKTIFGILDTWFGSQYDGSTTRLKMFEIFNSWH